VPRLNYYAVLGVPADADGDVIRSAFRELARQYHPDAGAGSSAEKFREIVEAYETLIDPSRRQLYDVSLTQPPPAMPVRVEPMIIRRRAGDPIPMPNQFFEFDRLFDEFSRFFDDDPFFGPVYFRWR